jgi:DNA-binding NarL/FixJ family response regulator
MNTVRILIAVSNTLFGLGLRSVLLQQAEFEVAEARTRTALLKEAHATQPHVVILDGSLCVYETNTYQHEAIEAVDIVAALRKKGRFAIFVIAASTDEEDLSRFMKSGALAVEQSTIGRAELVEKIRQVALGEYSTTFDNVLRFPISASVQRAQEETAEQERASRDQEFEPCGKSVLSSRQTTVLKYVARGYCNKEIAKALGISDQTVKNHLTDIHKRLEVLDRTAAVVKALRRGYFKTTDCETLPAPLGPRGGRTHQREAIAARV